VTVTDVPPSDVCSGNGPVWTGALDPRPLPNIVKIEPCAIPEPGIPWLRKLAEFTTPVDLMTGWANAQPAMRNANVRNASMKCVERRAIVTSPTAVGRRDADTGFQNSDYSGPY
jgi:hypothetical protein